MVFCDLKEDFLAVLIAHADSSTRAKGGFGIRARVGCITPRISKLELLVADNLHPQKARILLMVALTITKDRKLLQQMFAEY